MTKIMKELSIEEKRNYVFKSISRIGEIIVQYLDSMNKDNERLTKTTIAFLKDFADKGYENAVECIDWLEKQGEQKSADKVEPKFKIGDEISTCNEESLTITKIDEKGYWSGDLFVCSFEDSAKWQLVEKLVDKAEPKFHEGD